MDVFTIIKTHTMYFRIHKFGKNVIIPDFCILEFENSFSPVHAYYVYLGPKVTL